MGSVQPRPPLSRLWQLPLLLLSVLIFGYAVFAFVAPSPPPSIAQRLAISREYLKHQRADAAIAQLNGILASRKLARVHEGAARMLLGEAIDLAQQQRHISIPDNHLQIIRQIETAVALGIEPDANTWQRLAQSYHAIGRAADAIDRYRKAIALDRSRELLWLRRIIVIQLDRECWDDAAASLDQYLKSPGLADSERAWALGEQAHVLIDRSAFSEARLLLAEALKLEKSEDSEQGRYNYWTGYCAWKLGELPEAERHLRVARDLLRVQHPLDADAAYALGRIKQEQKDWATANSFYASVLQSHPDSPAALTSRLGRAVCRVATGQDDAGLSDFHDVVRVVSERESLPVRIRAEAILALQQAQAMLLNSGNTAGALELLSYEQGLVPKPPGEFFARLARVYERRANQLESDADASRRQKAREVRLKAGDAYVAYARELTLSDDKGYGMSMWKAIEQYDLAADLPRVIATLEIFVHERPNDASAPDALLRLGQAYHAAGLFDKAIGAYHRCQNPDYEKSLAASRSRVPLARTYIAKGPEFYSNAEAALRAVIENNPQVTPEAREFRDALLELARLFYRTGRYELAIARLEELSQRYPGDDLFGQVLFLMADSYRKSAAALDDRMKTAATRPALDVPEAARARQDRLSRARDLYQRSIDYYRTQQRPLAELDQLYFRLSHFYKADCVYDLGDYLQAIKLYDDAAFRYQDDPAAVAAYVQIVNANVALGRLEAARAANERAKWILERMPREVFEASSYAIPKTVLQQVLKTVGDSGLWK